MSYLKINRQLVDNQQFAELKAALLNNPDAEGNIQALPQLALAHAHLGEPQQALDIYVQVVACLSDLDMDARVDLAGVDCVLMRIENAIDLLEPVLKEQPHHSLALARLGWCRMQLGQLDEAQQLYQRSIEHDGQRLPVWMALVRLNLHAQHNAAAQDALKAGISCLEQRQAALPPTVVTYFTAQMRALQMEIWVDAAQFAEAEQWLQQRHESIEEPVWTELVIGYAALLAGRDLHAQAEEILREGLKQYPENTNLMVKIAELAQFQGHFMQAIRALRRAISFDRQNSTLWSRLSNSCLHRFDKQARAAAEKALELAEALQPSDDYPPVHIQTIKAHAQNALAQVESQERNFERAEQLYGEILNLNPYFVPALQGLAQQQMQQGKIDEALELYEKVKQVDPLKAHSALINARHFPEDVATLEKMELAAQVPSLGGRVCSSILFQVATAWEKRKDYTKAFELVRQANEASRKFLSYAPEAHRINCARIRHACCQSLYQHRQDCGVDSNLPVFVLGMPRSGTTLVEQIIAGHSKIFGAGELGVIPQRIQGLERWERHVGSGRHFPDCIDDLSPFVTEGIANGILTELKELAEKDKPGAEHVVDKLPHNFEHIGLIKFLFPNAKIISVRRDPRDIAISNYFTDYQAKHSGMGFAYDLTDIGEQLADHNLLMHHWNQVFPGEILEINYEGVVDDLEGSARKMLDYIGVDWEPQVLKFNELERTVKTASVWQVRQPIYTTSKAKWERYKENLAPLILGTNAKINFKPITDMLTLPEPSFLQNGVDLFNNDDLDGAELSFKKMLHYNPEHAACNYMVGLVYCRKGHVPDAIPLFEQALEKCPWQKEWRQNLEKAYEQVGEQDKLAELRARYSQKQTKEAMQSDTQEDDFDTDLESPITALYGNNQAVEL